jgi:regulator of CtrA degradation
MKSRFLKRKWCLTSSLEAKLFAFTVFYQWADEYGCVMAVPMLATQPQIRITRRVIDALYIEAMVLADEARAYFDRVSNDERDVLEPVLRVTFSCESLKVTTRLMHVIAWLLTRRAEDDGEIDQMRRVGASHRLGDAVSTEARAIARLPTEARELIFASCDLFERVRRIDTRLDYSILVASPARALQHQLERALA